MAKKSVLHRTIEGALARAAREFPVVVVTGPRQSGKSTLLRELAAPGASYVSLDVPDVRASAAADPRGFLAAQREPLILDEAQAAPELLTYIRAAVDEQRRKPGRFFISGSQNLLLSERVSETLAGRAAVLRLLPFSRAEGLERPERAPPWLAPAARRPATSTKADPWESFVRGSFPELATQPGRDAALWHSSYVQTYLERDVRTLRQVGDLGLFQSFVRALAARSGGLLNLHELSRDLGIAVNTAKAWVAVLEASYQIVVLRPHHANITKRLVKTPKVYFTDPGTLCWLVGLRDPEHLRHGPMAGAVFESWVLSEILKSFWHRGEEARVTFWRTATGDEVDFLVERGRRLVPIEVKATATPRPEHARGIERLAQSLDNLEPGLVVHTGDSRLPLGPHARAVPWSDI